MAPTWLYCLRCERAFLSDERDSCAYDDCHGQIPYIFEWREIRELKLHFPETPVNGLTYRLYCG